MVSGCRVACPNCQTELQVPAADPAIAVETASSMERVCAICQSEIRAEEAQTPCPICHARYHADCWTENGGCGVYGCSEVPQVEQRRALEIPISYWGQENKPCPACGTMILAAAVRCRVCGAKFESARPEDAGQFVARTERVERIPRMKRTIIWLFVFSVVPFLAPLGALWGVIWYPLNRKAVRAMPSFFPALCRISLLVSFGQCVLFLLMVGLYSWVRNP